jgi:hypothetical protein
MTAVAGIATRSRKERLTLGKHPLYRSWVPKVTNPIQLTVMATGRVTPASNPMGHIFIPWHGQCCAEVTLSPALTPLSTK